jgi:predicted transcriptional regulator
MLRHIPVSEIMQEQLVSAAANLNLKEFVHMLSPHLQHEAFPVFDDKGLVGAVSPSSVARIPPDKWSTTTVRDIADKRVSTVDPDCDVMEALRLLTSEHHQSVLLVVSVKGEVRGVVTKTDILQALKVYGEGRDQQETFRSR